MNEYSDLKAIAEACQQHQPLRFMRSHGALYIRNDNGIVFDVHQNRSFPEFMAQNKDYADLVLAANPATVLALIAENEALRVKLEVSEDTRQVLRGSLAQAEADIDALKVDWNGKVLCDLDLFENLRDAASTEADAHRQCMATYRPLRQEYLDSVVKRCDDLLAAMGKELVQ